MTTGRSHSTGGVGEAHKQESSGYLNTALTSDALSFIADQEEAQFRRFLGAPAREPATFEDPLYARVVDALEDLGNSRATPPRATPLDVAVLVRQVLRRASVRDGGDYRLVVSSEAGLRREHWESAGVTAIEAAHGATMLQAAPWQPLWLGRTTVDAAAGAGTAAGIRALHDNLPADPFFSDATTYQTYRTAGQRAAVRAALSMPESATLIALLPTGSGKTEVATTLARLARRQTTIIVVPTVSLAYDFERRFRETFRARDDRLDPQRLVFAWTGETDSETRERFRSLLISGQVPLLVTSPESLTGALLYSVRSAAEGGRLRALVIDEAHLVTQWGRDFRSEFRQLADLRADLLDRAQRAGHPGFRTVLLSATLGGAELDDLSQLFGQPGPLCLVAANALRPEPEYWVSGLSDDSVRAQRVLEAISHLPRPAILYVTRPAKADAWVRRLRAEGFGRVAVVTGTSPGVDRRDVLQGLRSGRGSTSRFDVVVATSAFGLGIDNDQIRTVIHACLPETLDRWYQEVGRSGRAGHTSVALLIPAYDDAGEAASLGITMLKPETAVSRWDALWGNRVSLDGNYVDLHTAPPGVETGSYNRRWNAQVLRGLEELGQIERRQLSLSEAAELELPIGTARRPHEWERVELVALDLHSDEFFHHVWETWRAGLLKESYEALNQMKAVLEPEASICDLLAAAYRATPAFTERHSSATRGVEPLPRCGRCPRCRAQGVDPQIERPPRGTYTWIPDLQTSPALDALLSAAPTGRCLAMLYSAEPAVAAPELANAAAAAGIRLFAGVTPSRPPVDWWCTDRGDVNPMDLPPLPALIIPPLGAPVDEAWLVAGLRPRTEDGEPTPVLLLVQVGTPIGAACVPVERLRTLDVHVAIRILASTHV